jgi:hypothetical protein
MKDSIKFRSYAEDCRRLAKQMKPEHRATLLEIAEAWDRCAEEAAGGAAKDQDDPTEEPGPRCRSARGKRNTAGRPPPGHLNSLRSADMV